MSRQQASVILDEIRSQHDNRVNAAGQCDHVIASYKSSKDQKKFRAAGRDIQSRYNEATTNISSLHKELASLDSDSAAKVDIVTLNNARYSCSVGVGATEESQ